MTTARPTILYIAGAGRSGTTLLGSILGQVKGFCFVGETVMFRKAPFAMPLCGCGDPILECGFWTTVRRAVGGGCRPVEDEELFTLARTARWRHLPLTFVPGGDRWLAMRYGEHWNGCARLYAAVATASGASVIVDSAKSVPYGRMLSCLPGLHLRVVHLVRDPRAVAYSWKRMKAARDRSTGYMKQVERGKATLFWVLNNLGAELLCRRAPDRYLRLRYEDLVHRPRESVERILRFVGEARCSTSRRGGASLEAPFIGDRTVELHATHSLWGNPDRFRTGVVELAPDDEWRAAMPHADRRFVAAVTWPLLVRYGYTRVGLPSRGGRA